jgi:hypothetical protein
VVVGRGRTQTSTRRDTKRGFVCGFRVQVLWSERQTRKRQVGWVANPLKGLKTRASAMVGLRGISWKSASPFSGVFRRF